MAKRRTTYLQLSLEHDDKKFLKDKASEYGYDSVSSFVVDSAKNHFKLELDLSMYRELAKEVNYVGKNINSLVRHIFTVGVYSENDLDTIKRNQEIIIEKLNSEYDHLLNLRKKYSSSNMSLKDKKNLINELKKKEINIPKKLVLEEVFERIKDDVLYIYESIDNSPNQEEGVADYVLEYIYGETIFSLSEEKLIEFADRLFIFTQQIKFKQINPQSYFDDDDWFDLKEILDEYEVL